MDLKDPPQCNLVTCSSKSGSKCNRVVFVFLFFLPRCILCSKVTKNNFLLVFPHHPSLNTYLCPLSIHHCPSAVFLIGISSWGYWLLLLLLVKSYVGVLCACLWTYTAQLGNDLLWGTLGEEGEGKALYCLCTAGKYITFIILIRL